MGNRAVLTFSDELSPNAVGVYVHWVGSPNYIEKILELCRSRTYRTPSEDETYAMARLIEAACEIAGAHEPGGVGVGVLKELDTDNGDNGTYIIGGEWVVLRREHA